MGTSNLDVQGINRFWKKTCDSQGVSFCQGEGCPSIVARILEDLQRPRLFEVSMIFAFVSSGAAHELVNTFGASNTQRDGPSESIPQIHSLLAKYWNPENYLSPTTDHNVKFLTQVAPMNRLADGSETLAGWTYGPPKESSASSGVATMAELAGSAITGEWGFKQRAGRFTSSLATCSSIGLTHERTGATFDRKSPRPAARFPASVVYSFRSRDQQRALPL